MSEEAGVEPSGADAHGDAGEAAAYDTAGAALGALSPDDQADVLAAAEHDASLAAELAAMQQVVADLACAASPELINRGRSAGIRSRLLARATATRAGRPASRQPPVVSNARERHSPDVMAASGTRPVSGSHVTHPEATKHEWHHELRPLAATGSHVPLWVIIGVLVLAALVGVQFLHGSRSLPGTRAAADAASATPTRDSALEQQVSQLRASIAQRDSVIASLTGPRTRVIDLVGYASINPVARVFWNQKTQVWTLFASNLKQLPEGRTYQLWIIARGQPSAISAGTFTPDASGSAMMTARYALEPGSLRRLAVTQEPAGGGTSPTGAIVFAGK